MPIDVAGLITPIIMVFLTKLWPFSITKTIISLILIEKSLIFNREFNRKLKKRTKGATKNTENAIATKPV